MQILKDMYKEYFRIGVACERISERFTNHEIGNPEKEKKMAEQFNSMTFANELKPAYNMGFSVEEATEEYLPFAINPQAKAMLDWAKENKMPVRGHVLVWHSQCPKEIFCKDYEPVTIPTDPEVLKKNPMMKHFEKLDPVCFVSRETMLKRLESYINSVMEYMFSNDYANVIYAWDVVNEAIELADKTPTGLRDSYWYQVIGDDFIYWAFRFTKNAVVAASKKYAAKYGVDPEDEEALKTIQPKLFYNDYNEWMPDKKEAIIAALDRATEEHGSIFGEGLIDGIGMQGHLSDNNDIEEYMTALRDYAKLVDEVQITELDVKCTCTNANAEYYQAVFYKKLFEELIKAKKEGYNITTATFWGLTDDNSWIRDANPLLFRKDLSHKKAFDALVYALTGESLGEPEQIVCDLSERLYDFAPAADGTPMNLDDNGFKFRGFGMMALTDKVAHSGKWCLGNEKRFGDWCGITYDASDFIGQTVEIGAWVLCSAKEVTLSGDFGGKFELVASANTSMGGALTAGAAVVADPIVTVPQEDGGELKARWVHMSGKVQIPGDLHSAVFIFNVKDEEGTISPLYLDELTVKLIGQEESFEGEKHIASIRGAGHLPFIAVVDNESRDGKSHSLMVTRQEKDATVKFGISSYIGHTVKITAYVKTEDKVVKMGLDGAVSVQFTEVPVVAGEWTEITAVASLPQDLRSAEFYLETDGNATFFVDDIFVMLES